jgi:hypothetical protein
MVKYSHVIGLLCLLSLGMVGIASADSLYNFDTTSIGTSTQFSLTSNSLAAAFSSNDDPGGFVVVPSFFNTLTGNVLLDPGPAGADNLFLGVAFSANVNSISLDFATNGPGTFALLALENGSPVGLVFATGTVPSGFIFPEGTITFNGANFNEVVMGSSALDFAVDNIDVKPVATPEPASLLLLGSGLVALLMARRRRIAA